MVDSEGQKATVDQLTVIRGGEVYFVRAYNYKNSFGEKKIYYFHESNSLTTRLNILPDAVLGIA